MRLFLIWMVAFGIIAGLQGRTYAVDPCEVIASMHEHAHEQPDSDHREPAPCDSSHDDQCPTDHHHHHIYDCLCHGMPLTDATDARLRLNGPDFSLSRYRHEGEVAPEGPCLGEDKPPLI